MPAISCTGCHKFHYCSEKCRESDWQQFHGTGECIWYKENNQKAGQFISLEEVPLMMRMYFMAKSKLLPLFMRHQCHDGREISYYDIPFGFITSKSIRTLMQPLIETLDGTNNSKRSQSAYLLMPGIFNRIMQHAVLTRDDTALALYVPVSVMKHSCRPNASFITINNQIRVRAMRNIAVNEEVTIDKADVLMLSKAERHAKMVFRGPACACERCKAGDEANEITKLAIYKSLQQRVIEYYKSRSNDMSVFDALVCEMTDTMVPIKQKFTGPHHPDLTMLMLFTAECLLMKHVITSNDKQDFMYLHNELFSSIPVTHGTDDANISIQKLDQLMQKLNFSDCYIPNSFSPPKNVFS
jgi:hypothetical protein